MSSAYAASIPALMDPALEPTTMSNSDGPGVANPISASPARTPA